MSSVQRLIGPSRSHGQRGNEYGILRGGVRRGVSGYECPGARGGITPGKLAESGSMIFTAHSFLPSLAEMRLGWSLAVPRTRSVRDPGASRCARQFVLTVLAHAVIALSLTIWNQISNLIVNS